MMKKMWKKNTKAVSPVIATILMVAITVVLAAVLYVMVMGFGGPSNTVPTGSFSAKDKISETTEKLTFGVITPEKPGSAFKVVVSEGTSSATFAITDDSGTLVAASGTLTTVTVSFTDLAGNKVINNGDYLLITGQAGHTYNVSLLYSTTGDQITSTSFTL